MCKDSEIRSEKRAIAVRWFNGKYIFEDSPTIKINRTKTVNIILRYAFDVTAT